MSSVVNQLFPASRSIVERDEPIARRVERHEAFRQAQVGEAVFSQVGVEFAELVARERAALIHVEELKVPDRLLQPCACVVAERIGAKLLPAHRSKATQLPPLPPPAQELVVFDRAVAVAVKHLSGERELSAAEVATERFAEGLELDDVDRAAPVAVEAVESHA
eukprot:CAMPEP_0119397950 /NCGR_PEP_ID=MMETSP1334-20130426/140595_1 /TAXON_ID=127549 /ORGANISM="Calcidiscus leptoporus, Strain RCC1130" /LENGTH=163 /DNA_ID=CAMNT_0007421801 /DNA_START=533 /DNA_END=1025 /DNA_ORIENTATION=-